MIRLALLLNQAFLITLFRLVGASARIIDSPDDQIASLHRRGKRVIFALWHEFSVVGIYWYRHRGGSALVENSWRGDSVAACLRHFGFQDFRIPSNGTIRQAARGVIGFIRYLASGHDGTIATDGPSGPARQTKTGILHIAAKSGNLVLPAGAWFSHSIRFSKRWDNYQIPLPFCRVHIVLGEPISIPKDYRGQEDELLHKINTETERVTAEAERQGKTHRQRKKTSAEWISTIVPSCEPVDPESPGTTPHKFHHYATAAESDRY